MLKEHRPLHTIAEEIRRDWTKQRADGRIPPAAEAYLRPMETLTSIRDNFFADSAESVVRYFLSNASSWRGDVAQRVKHELNMMIKDNKS